MSAGAAVAWGEGPANARLPAGAVPGVDTADQLDSTTNVIVWTYVDYHPVEVPPSTFDPPSYCSCT